MIIALLDPKREFSRLCAALGEAELAINPMFATTAARKQNAAELRALPGSEFESKPLSHWRERFCEHDIKWSTLPTLDEAVRDPQMRDSGAIIEFDYQGYGLFETINSPIFIEESKKVAPRVPPDYGEHTREIL